MIRVKENNPYVTGFVLISYNRLFRNPVEYVPSPQDKFHIINQGDSLDKIAYDKYGDSKLWWILWDINNKVLDNPFLLPIGVSIIIPNLELLQTTQL